MQRIDVHPRCQRFREPFFQAGPKSPGQVIDRPLEKSSAARRKNHHSRNSRSTAQNVDRSYKAASPVRIENRPAQKRQHPVGSPCPKNVGRPQVTRFERRAKSVRGLPSHAGVYAFEQDPVVSRRNPRESRESHSRLDGRRQRSGQRGLCESRRIRARFGRQNRRQWGNLGRCERWRGRSGECTLRGRFLSLCSRRRRRVLRGSLSTPQQKQCHKR